MVLKNQDLKMFPLILLIVYLGDLTEKPLQAILTSLKNNEDILSFSEGKCRHN